MFERGFKSWCERHATSLRTQLGLAPTAPLDPRQLAHHLNIAVCTPRDIPGLSQEALGTLLQNDNETPSAWSAVTVIEGSKTLVILNCTHSLGRQSSDLMHELAHRILSHAAHGTGPSIEGIMLLSGYDKQQEDEADWLSATLLLPRSALVSIKRRRLEDREAASAYNVSVRMLKYRMAMTGVARQYA